MFFCSPTLTSAYDLSTTRISFFFQLWSLLCCSVIWQTAPWTPAAPWLSAVSLKESHRQPSPGTKTNRFCSRGQVGKTSQTCTFVGCSFYAVSFPLPLSGIVLSEGDGTLHIDRITVDDQGLYTCLATNDRGSAQSSAFIRVNSKWITCFLQWLAACWNVKLADLLIWAFLHCSQLYKKKVTVSICTHSAEHNIVSCKT